MGLSIFGHAWCLLYCELHLLNRHAIILVYNYNNINAGTTEFHDVKRLEMISKTGWIKKKYLKMGGFALEKMYHHCFSSKDVLQNHSDQSSTMGGVWNLMLLIKMVLLCDLKIR